MSLGRELIRKLTMNFWFYHIFINDDSNAEMSQEPKTYSEYDDEAAEAGFKDEVIEDKSEELDEANEVGQQIVHNYSVTETQTAAKRSSEL